MDIDRYLLLLLLYYWLYEELIGLKLHITSFICRLSFFFLLTLLSLRRIRIFSLRLFHGTLHFAEYLLPGQLIIHSDLFEFRWRLTNTHIALINFQCAFLLCSSLLIPIPDAYILDIFYFTSIFYHFIYELRLRIDIIRWIKLD